jgi:hypothetical protein
VGEIVSVTLSREIASFFGVSLDKAYALSFTVRSGVRVAGYDSSIQYNVDTNPIDVIASDFDNDGDLDLAVGNDGSAYLSILTNNGDGSFLPHITYTIDEGISGIASVDIDLDGDIDMVTANHGPGYAGSVARISNYGDGTFGSKVLYSVGSNASSIIASDLDGDCDIDIAATRQHADDIIVFSNNGDGSFSVLSYVPAGDYSVRLASSDLNNDYFIDLATSNGNGNNISVILNDGNAQFIARTLFGVGYKPLYISSSDLNGDGNIDLIVSCRDDNSIEILYNQGDAIFSNRTIYAVGNEPYGINAADLDGDGDIDIACANLGSDNVSILENNGAGVFSPYLDVNTGDGPHDLISADLNGDKVLDLVIVNFYSNNISILFGKSLKIVSLSFPDEISSENVINHTPLISWDYIGAIDPTAFQIAVGTDTDWTIAEMWNPDIFYSSDTSVTYGGESLIDGEIYYIHLRIGDGTLWSEWYETSFQMNSLATIPAQISPIDYAIVNNDQPTLWIQNSTDAEGDDLFYDFTVLVDCVMIAGSNIPQQVDSTGWTVDTPLDDNLLHVWYARAYDGYEYSDWSNWEYFWINAVEEYPTAFDLQYPPDTGWSQVLEFPATFQWGISSDPDPLDSVHYRLIVALDSNFTFTAIHDSIFPNYSDLPVLDYGTHYWWKVLALDTKGNETQCNNEADFLTWVLGDANQDGSTDVGDAVFLINFVFKGGYFPEPYKVGDANADCEVNIGDAVYLISYIFKGGPAPGVGCAVGMNRAHR